MRDIISVVCEIIAILFWFTIWIIGMGMIIAGSSPWIAVMGFIGLIVSPIAIGWFRRDREIRRGQKKKKSE